MVVESLWAVHRSIGWLFSRRGRDGVGVGGVEGLELELELQNFGLAWGWLQGYIITCSRVGFRDPNILVGVGDKAGNTPSPGQAKSRAGRN